jgi:hypothetical protein
MVVFPEWVNPTVPSTRMQKLLSFTIDVETD